MVAAGLAAHTGTGRMTEVTLHGTAAGAGALHAPAANDVEAKGLETWSVLLQAACKRYVNLVDEADPQWVKPWLPAALGTPAAWTPVDRQCLSAALLSRFSLEWPAVSCWLPRIHRIGLLKRADALRVLGALAVFCHPSLLTHSLDAGRWRCARELLGEPTCERLIACAPAAALPAPKIKGVLTAAALAEIGLSIVDAALLPTNANVVNLMRFYLPVRAPLRRPPSPAQCARAAVVCTAFLTHLDELFPDLIWLFGSNSVS
jgi:hypothetical protein